MLKETATAMEIKRITVKNNWRGKVNNNQIYYKQNILGNLQREWGKGRDKNSA